MMLMTSPFQIATSIYVAVQGAFRGCGMQKMGAKLNLFAYLVIGIPFGLLLVYAFEGGLIGLWVGVSSGFLVCAISGGIWLSIANWDQMAQDAQIRTVEHIHGAMSA